jgi:hypothetical protein
MRRTVIHGPLVGITDYHDATLVDTEVSGNPGPAIFNRGSMHLTRTAVVDNEASGDVFGTFPATGIVNESGELWLDDSTVRGNTAISPVDLDSDRGVQGGGITNFARSFAARSPSSPTPSCATPAAAPSPPAPARCSASTRSWVRSTTTAAPTLTMALDPSSPAVDAGPLKKRQGRPKTDQRGVTRPQGARCDIGAYELLGA